MAEVEACLRAAAAWAVAAATQISPVLIRAVLGAVLTAWLIVKLLGQRVPSIEVEPISGEASPSSPRRSPRKPSKSIIPCHDPGTQELLGYVPAMGAAQVRELAARAKEAGKEWRGSSFAQRRLLLKILLKFIMFYKAARVEYVPVGVVGAIVPWNYPFHNIFNPLTAALFAGNAIVVKVSEHACWSSVYYKRIIDAALVAAGAPPDLVQIVTGYGEAGNALVTSPDVGKLIFVGSTQIGRKVMEAAAANLTPVVLELGGKDAFIVCEDADLGQVLPTALRGAFQSCGQNCAGGERFIVHEQIHDEFVRRAAEVTSALRQGPASGEGMVDCGAIRPRTPPVPARAAAGNVRGLLGLLACFLPGGARRVAALADGKKSK
ncbi:hypothetical protein CHLNCDRAFT_143835 [Chlorella variabilis]|uniref:Aldehyde dehydrogenase domain-containing protein n=1 Tax=Chlorella variabilis TaxID=554065 RepID=E1ZAJ4_CHLVA|nr:hypothetical protein CHLNCDRAFT_143835 [Chlorella variabilis]EFN57269.1 hypothetical protein CHLNCDRAFT_143835 [Chlorella variabilis]|eukprot:XP_005849371.1 hypothetical protein CHLNCDRAFT_143835 [Chlorella variabilis]